MQRMSKLLLRAFQEHPNNEQVQNWSRVALALCRVDVERFETRIEAMSRRRVPAKKKVSLGELARNARRLKVNDSQIGYFLPVWNEGQDSKNGAEERAGSGGGKK